MNYNNSLAWPLLVGAACTFLSAERPASSFENPAFSGLQQASASAAILPDTIEDFDSSRFTYLTLVSGLDEPMGMAILPNYDVVVAERKGAVRYYSNTTKELKTIAQFNVFSGIEDGLLGMAADPDFKNNNWLYFYYAVGGDKNVSHLARYTLKGERLDLVSKKVLLEVPTQRTYCCHSAGYLTFGSDGLLYLSIGDNTNAEEIEGHSPTDERPGRELSDDQASTANSNDYRGKILRIKPEPNGTYSIPEGNLFPMDGSSGKPEIYVMGVRNPFRMSVDPETQYVYWGDVGPDTEVKAEEGKLSYDEINQARKPGFFGYPYFLGGNEAFPKYDFATKQEGPVQDPLNPVNNSPHNTGIKKLPQAQPAFIWYGKGPSKRWPLVGKGGASAMAGPVYYSNLYPNAPYKLPNYYSGKLFIYDWIRKWIMVVTMDRHGNYVSMEPFLPQLNVVAPIDMQIAPDGAIYLLAYGTNWFARNTDSGIIRVEYSKGNRNPIALARLSQTVGAAPLSVTLSAKETKDYDAGDVLSYVWTIGNMKRSGQQVKHTFTKPGVYNVILAVTDQHGGKGTATTQIKVGNTPPVVAIQATSNRSFYWDQTSLAYQIIVKDKEDKVIDPNRIRVRFNYLPFGKDLASVLSSSEEVNLQHAQIPKLIASLDCKACHAVDTKSVGPAFREVSRRYQNKEGAAEMLAGKIIQGGSGNWGTYPMPPHADLPEKAATDIAAYILSLEKKEDHMPLAGQVRLDQHAGKGTEGAYVLQAGYTDNGANGIEAMKSRSYLVLKNPLIQMEDYEEGNVNVVIATKNTGYISYVANITDGKYTRFGNIDLNQIKSIRFRVKEAGDGGKIEVHLGGKQGPLVGVLEVPAGKVKDVKTEWKEMEAIIKPTTGFHDLYFVFRNPQTNGGLFYLDWMYFDK